LAIFLGGGDELVSLREAKKQQTHRTILTEASRLFVEVGYEKTTLADIASACQIGVGTIYNYFPSKPVILLSLFEDGLDEDIAFIGSILGDAQLLGIDKISRITERFVSSLLDKPRSLLREMMRLTLSNDVDAPQILRSVFHADETFLQLVRQCIQSDIQAGKYEPRFQLEQAIAVYYNVLRSEIFKSVTSEERPISSVIEDLQKQIEFIFTEPK
jgi:AcrR family transcriptional regulator